MAPPTNVKLVYFNGRGRAEVCRWVLAHAGASYEDKRIEFANWKEMKPDTVGGTLPYAEIDGKYLGCSGAIAWYFSKQYGLLGSDDFEEAEVRWIVDLVEDAMVARIKAHFAKDEDKEELWKKYGENALANLIRVSEKQLKRGTGWLVGDKISLADLSVAWFMDEQKEPFDAQVKAVKELAALMTKVKEMPNIKKWIDERPVTQF